MAKYLNDTGLSHLMTKIKAAIAATVTGVKGNAETSYRTGQVNLTYANLGTAPIANGGTGATTAANARKNLELSDIGYCDGYINTQPENNGSVIIPFINNDIAFLLKRGGSAVVKYDGVVQNVDISNAFDGSPSYWGIKYTGTTEIVIELTLHKVFSWTNYIYIDFGPWYTKTIKVEVTYDGTTYPNDTWTEKLSTTTNTRSFVVANATHTPVGASNSGGGFNKVRLTFSFANGAYSSSMFRIAQIGVLNYGSNGVRETYMSRGIDDSLFRDITPAFANTYNLGSSTLKWANIYATTFNGALTGNVTGNCSGTASNVTGTVAVANGGTGQTSAVNAANSFLNALSTGSSDPQDADYYISQYAGGGTTTTTYHRRPMSALWNYIKGKISSVLGLTATQYGGNAATATSASNVTGTVAIANGGTGATAAADAWTALGGGAIGKKTSLAASDIPELSTDKLTSGTLGVTRGGTGKATHTSNAVLTGNGTSAVNNVATASGALYATAANGAPSFGTLPIAQGGTGKTTAADAWTALGGGAIGKKASLAASDIPAHASTATTYGAASTTNYGHAKLSSATDSSSEALAATPKAVKTVYDLAATANSHATDSSRLTTAQSSGLYKIATTAEGHVASVTAVQKSDITGLGIPGSDTHYASKNVVGSSTATSNTTSALTNGNVYLNSVENGAVTSAHKISGTDAVTVTTDASGNILVNAHDTTYSSKAAFSGGTDVSLVTTGEKATWNSKTSNTGTVTKVSTGVGLTGGDITGTGTVKAKLKSETASTLDSAAMGSTASRQYAVGVDKSGYLSVNVPWTDTVTGVKGGSESSYRTGNVNITATNIGLGNVDNTSDANKPISTATQAALDGKVSTSVLGAANGVATLNANGTVPESQLPSYVDDVLEYSAQSAFPTTGESGKIYVTLDTNKTYRWSGSAYVEISASLALGTTSSTAYRGDYGNTAYSHAIDSSRLTTAQSSGLYKIATTAQGHVASVTAVAKSDITGLGIPAQDTTYSAATTSAAGLMSADDKTKLNGIDAGANAYTHPTSSGNKHIPSGGSSGQFLGWSADGTAAWVANPNTDTKNTAGSTDSSKKLFLVGAESQAASPQTYSQDTAYVGTDGHLYSNGVQVVNLSDSQALTNKTYNGYTLAAACAKAVTDSSSASAIGTGTSLTTERDVYYGLPTINNAHNYNSGTTIYAPTAGGTAGYELVGNGTTSAPVWKQTPYANCSEAAGTAAKTAALTNFKLVSGAHVFIRFANANTASAPTLNVNSTGAKSMYYAGAVITGSNFVFKTNVVYEFVYASPDNTNFYWMLVGMSGAPTWGWLAGKTS